MIPQLFIKSILQINFNVLPMEGKFLLPFSHDLNNPLLHSIGLCKPARHHLQHYSPIITQSNRMKFSKRLQPYIRTHQEMNCSAFILQKCSNKITWINSVNVQYFSPHFLKQTCIVMAVYQILSKKVIVNGKNQHCRSKHVPFIPATAILWHTHKLLLDLALATLKQCLSVVQSLRPLSLTLGCISMMPVWSPSLPLAGEQRLSDLIWEIKQSIHCI